MYQRQVQIKERQLMMSDFRGEGGGSKMTQKYWTLESKNRTLGGGGSKMVANFSDIIYYLHNLLHDNDEVFSVLVIKRQKIP